MIWVLLSFLTALCQSLKGVFSKKSLQNVDEYVVAFSFRFFASLFLLPLLFFIEIPTLGKYFWISLVLAGLSVLITTVLVLKALKYSDLSKVTPMVTFTPLFMLITSPLIVGEFPTSYGLIGVLLIVLGSYMLNIKHRSKGYLIPFRYLVKEKGPRYMLLVAFIWAIGSNIDKIGVQNSSPLFWAIIINAFATVLLLPIVLSKSSQKLKPVKSHWLILLAIGLMVAFGLGFQMTAINLTQVVYVISIKRTSVIMSVIFGYFIFKEKEIKQRLLGSAIMVAGVLLISFA